MKVYQFTMVLLLVLILFIAFGNHEIQTTVRQIPEPTVPGGKAERHFYKHFYKGISAAAAGDFKTAVIAFSKALAQDLRQINSADLTAKRSLEIIKRVEQGLLDKRAASHLFQGFAYFNEVEDFLISPIIECDSYILLINSFSDRKGGAITSAAAEYEQAIEIEPDFAEAHNALADIHATRGSLDEALRELERAVEIQPDYAEAYSGLGKVNLHQGKVDKAIAQCKKALEIRPSLATAHLRLGLAYQQKGMLDEAIIEYRTAIKIVPDLLWVRGRLVEAYQKNGMNDESKAEQKKVQDMWTEIEERCKKAVKKKKESMAPEKSTSSPTR